MSWLPWPLAVEALSALARSDDAVADSHTALIFAGRFADLFVERVADGDGEVEAVLIAVAGDLIALAGAGPADAGADVKKDEGVFGVSDHFDQRWPLECHCCLREAVADLRVLLVVVVDDDDDVAVGMATEKFVERWLERRGDGRVGLVVNQD